MVESGNGKSNLWACYCETRLLMGVPLLTTSTSEHVLCSHFQEKKYICYRTPERVQQCKLPIKGVSSFTSIYGCDITKPIVCKNFSK